MQLPDRIQGTINLTIGRVALGTNIGHRKLALTSFMPPPIAYSQRSILDQISVV